MATSIPACWYFDLISPYAYLHLKRLGELDPALEITPVPVLFAGLLKHFENKGPAELAPKRVHTYRNCVWMARRHGIRTIINLRGPRECGSDSLSRAAADRLGIAHVYMPFESRGAPHRERILRFHQIWREVQTPVLMHCKSGADRAGLAAGLVLMFEGGTAAEAMAQLSLRFGHFRRSASGILDAFFLRYQAEGEGRMPFLDWVKLEYDEDALRRDFRASGISSFLNDRVLRRE